VLKDAPAPLVARSFSALGLRAARLRRPEAGQVPEAPVADGQDLSRLQPAAQKATRRLALRGRVLQSFLAHAPEALAARGHIRGRRAVPDSEVARWMVPRPEWDARFA
jgi:hypothetical protein